MALTSEQRLAWEAKLEEIHSVSVDLRALALRIRNDHRRYERLIRAAMRFEDRGRELELELLKRITEP